MLVHNLTDGTDEMVKRIGIPLGNGFDIDKKTGKPKRTTKRLAKNIQIAKRKKEKVTYRRGK